MIKFGQKKYLTKIRDYKSVFSSVEGKRVLFDMMKEFGFSTPLIDKKKDITSEALAFGEGQRNTVLYILSQLKLNPEEIQKHLEEQIKHEQSTYENFD